MSLQSLTTIAAQRDTGGPKKANPTPATTEDATKTVSGGYLDVLVSAIPTEPLGLYTFLVGVVVGTISTGESKLLGMRWAIYGATIAFIIAWLAVGYTRKSKVKSRKFPWVETATAAVAFAAWGLAMPESPLSASIHGDQRAIWTAIITVAGVAIIGLLGVPLQKPVKK
jgi:hypothetical protein